MAQARAEYRGYWVDTFNTALNNHNDVVAVVNNATASNSNAIFVQVRRRGDSWYLNSLEPKPDFVPIEENFDPLADLINVAHSRGVEVHAFVIMSAIWSKNPTFAPTATLGPPIDPNHVFNRHGGYDPVTKTIIPGPNNWLTRSLLASIPFQGHRFGSDFWLDFGHPDAAAYTVDVVMHLIRNYAIDGLHLDRIRYPDFSATGQTPSTGANIGYNSTSVARFQQHYGIPLGSPPPEPKDAQWAQWRRDQVSNIVRRVYLNAIAIRPNLKISAATIVYGGGPTTESGWNSAEAYWRVYQDWRAWTEEGILDIAIPMNYKREHTASNVPMFDTWNEWAKNHQYSRSAMIGVGVYLNSIEGSLRQIRRSLTPSSTGNSVIGVNLYAMATTNDAVPANPWSFPAGQNTPIRPFAEFASGMTTGRSVDNLVPYEDQGVNPVAIFADWPATPSLPWKISPTKGHLMGFAKRSDNTALDTASVVIRRTDGAGLRNTSTDGGGFYGGVDLQPGQYVVKAQLGQETLWSCSVGVTAGAVTSADLHAETTAPATTASLDPAAPTGSNGWYAGDVTVRMNATDDCAGVEKIQYSINGGTWADYAGAFVLSSEGTTTVDYAAVDYAGNVEATKSFTVMVDKTAPTIQLSATSHMIWPPNGKMIPVTLSGKASDATSGLFQVSYVVTDEYGAPLVIPQRSLAGGNAEWADVLAVEARRPGQDMDGRLYRITATVADQAGNTATASVDVVVAHDQGH
jgi:uncharacterized lipoprotein YddW (UPF0748 family)